MKKPGLLHSLRRHRLLLPVTALLLASANWACDPGKTVGTATTDRPVARLQVAYSSISAYVGEGDAFNGFDADNAAFADPLVDAIGRLFGVDVEWTSSNPAVVSIPVAKISTTSPGQSSLLSPIRKFGSKVVFTPVKPGTATITGTVVGSPTVNNQPVTTSFTVVVYPVPTKLVVDPKTLTIAVNGTAPLSSKIFSADGTQVPSFASWTCVDPTIAGVSLAGNANVCGDIDPDIGVYSVAGNDVVVHGRKSGSTLLIASYTLNIGNGNSVVTTTLADTVRVTVSSGITRVVVTPSSAALVVGGQRSFTAQAFDAAGNVVTGQTTTWSSSITSVLTADAGGSVRGIASGAAPGQTQTASVIATIGGVTGQAAVTVYRKPANVLVTPSPNVLAVNQTATLHAKLVDTDNTTQIPFSAASLSWISDNPAIARITTVDDSTATVTGVAVGATLARASTVTGATGTADVTVRAAAAVPASIDLFVTIGGTTRAVFTTGESVNLGGTLPLSATVRDAGGAAITDPVTWTSAAPTIVPIDATTGLLTGKALGSALITAKSTANPSITKTVVVTVTGASSGGAPASISISPTSATIKDGQTQQFTATLRDAAGNVVPIPAGGQIDFVVDDSNIAEPLNTTGLIMAYETGATTVRALYRINGAQTNLNAAAALTVIPK